MGQKIEYIWSEDAVYFEFVYQSGERDELVTQLLNAFEKDERFTKTTEMSFESDSGSILFYTDDVPGITNMFYLYNYRWEGETDALDLWYAPLLRFPVDPDYLYDNDDEVTDPADEAALEELIDIVSLGYLATDDAPLAVYASTPKQRFYRSEAEQPPFTARSLAHDEYACLSWLTVFTPPMVETYGRETLRSAPAYRTRELDDGAIVLVCHDTPFDWDADCRAVADHIGLPLLQDLASTDSR